MSGIYFTVAEEVKPITIEKQNNVKEDSDSITTEALGNDGVKTEPCTGRKRGFICCGGVYHVQKKRNKLKCCGATPFSPKTHKCCHGTVSAIPRNPATKERITNAKCCDDKAYNPLTSGCCRGTLKRVNLKRNPNRDDYACCIDKFYDKNRMICCKGRLTLMKSSAMKCCGTRAFDPVTQDCIVMRKVVKKELSKPETMSTV